MTAPVIVHDTLRPDGTLELNQAVNLPPGPVMVSVQSVLQVVDSVRGLANVIDEIRHGQQARAFQERSTEEIEAAQRRRSRIRAANAGLATARRFKLADRE